MGTPLSEVDRYKGEDPLHQVTLARPFAVGRFTISFERWDACGSADGAAATRGTMNSSTRPDAGAGHQRRRRLARLSQGRHLPAANESRIFHPRRHHARRSGSIDSPAASTPRVRRWSITCLTRPRRRIFWSGERQRPRCIIADISPRIRPGVGWKAIARCRSATPWCAAGYRIARLQQRTNSRSGYRF